MKVYLGDLVHNVRPGGNILTGKNDFTVPLNIANLAAYARKIFGNEIELRLFKYPNDLLSAVENDPPNVLGLSNYAWNTDLNNRVGTYIKKYYPKILTVMGGPAMRGEPGDIEGYLRRSRHIDAYILYEGEGPFVQILQHVLESGPEIYDCSENLKNVAYLAKDRFFYTHDSKLKALDEYPSPYLNGMLDEFLEKSLIPLFETNRGCPYSCTFCSWGISSLSKVRKFSEKKILCELDYVADRYPEIPIWIFADANFGILKRDIDIAKKIREIKDRTPKLEKITTWDSKNNHDRNSEISNIINRETNSKQISNANFAYIALQNLSPRVLKNIRRDNIKAGNLHERVEQFHKRSIKVTTDILYVLPGETLDDAIETLRECFSINFDYINIGRTLTLPGSEMETSESRKQFGIKTKYMIRRGSYGEYKTKNGTIKSMEHDEIIVANSAFQEEESLFYHSLQWLIYYNWNHGKFAPLLKYLFQEYGINPVDFFIKLLKTEKINFPHVDKLFENLRKEITSAIFDTPEAMREFYFKKENWESLLSYIRVELKYNALMYFDPFLYEEYCGYLKTFLNDFWEDQSLKDIFHYLKENFISIQTIVERKNLPEKKMKVRRKALSFILNSDAEELENKDIYLKLFKTKEEQSKARDFLLKHDYNTDPINAVERLIGANYPLLNYNVETKQEPTINRIKKKNFYPITR